MEQYEYKKMNYESLSDVAHVVERLTGKRLSSAYYQKKYITPWANDQYQGWMAYDKQSGKVAAIVAALPLLAQLPNGQTVPLTHIIETFTLPEHQGKGLMTILSKKIIAEHSNAGTHLFLAMTNQNNVHGFVNKLGFTKTHAMEVFQVNIRTLPFEALCRRSGLTALFRWWGNTIIQPYLAPKGTILANSVQDEGYGGIQHNQAFFEYKTFTFNRLCHFSGISSWLKFDAGLLVGDVALPQNCPDTQLDEWLTTLQKIARRMGLRKIFIQTYPGSPMNKKLTTRYTPRPSWSICCLATSPEMQPFLDQMRFGFGDFDTF